MTAGCIQRFAKDTALQYSIIVSNGMLLLLHGTARPNKLEGCLIF
jgi:hypothetical protein